MDAPFKYFVMGIALCLLTATTGWAQGTDEGKDLSQLTSEKNLSLIEEDVSSLSMDAKLERSAEKIKKMKGLLEETSQLLSRARGEEKDILKINCINEKLAAMKGFIKVSEQSYGNLKSAASRDDAEAANHHYTLVAIANQKVRNLNQEAQLCTGEVQTYAGSTQLDVDVDDDIGDSEEVPDDGEIDVVGRLPELTPFQ